MRSPLVLLPLAILAIAPLHAQALRGHNSNAPVDVAADRIEVQDRADRAVFSGNVIVNQSGMRLTASRLTVAYSKGGGGVDIDRLDASGGVSVVSDTETARGNFATYDLNRRLITMVGDVQLAQRGNQVRGGRLVIDLDTGRAVVDGSAVGQPGVAGSGGRVTGRFTVKQKTN